MEGGPISKSRTGLTLLEVMVGAITLCVLVLTVVALISLRRAPSSSLAPEKAPEKRKIAASTEDPSELRRTMAAALPRAREEARRIRCRNNLNQLAKGMATYLNEYGDNRFYPCPLGRGAVTTGYNGAEWFAALYWTGTVPDPGVFICPSSGDTNHDGADIGFTRTTAAFGSQTVSYAGMHWRSITPTGSAIRDDFPPNEVMASDDTEGTVNHGEAGMCVMFFDSHVEWRTADEIDPLTAVGQKGGLLEKLRN